MTTITRERLTKILIETMALIKERSSRTGDASGISTEVNASLFAEVTRMALASLTAEPALYAAEETLAYAKMGELHLTCLSEPMGDAVIPLYTAPPAPVSVPVALNRLRSIVADPRALPRRKEWISGQQYSYVLLENVEAMVDDACRAALLQGSQPVSNRDELLTVCAEAYQVVGAMAEALGVFDSTEVQKVMDNLSQQKLVHADVLPFAVPGGNSPVIPDSLVMATIIDV